MMNGSVPVQSPAEAIRRYLDQLPREIPVREELSSHRFWKAVRVEFLAALLAVLFGCGASWLEDDEKTDDEMALLLREMKAALVVGFAVVTIVHCFGSVNCAHGNPAVSVAMLITRNISPIRTFFYFISQCLGAIVGAAVFYGLTPMNLRTTSLGITSVHEEMHLSQAFGVEFLTTLVVVLAVLTRLDSNTSPTHCRALCVGLAYAIGQLFAYRWTGASMNPARSLGPAIVMNKWQNHWVYWVGPVLGGIIGAFTHEYTRESCPTNQQHGSKRSFRRKFEGGGREMKRDQSALCSQETELTTTSLDGRI